MRKVILSLATLASAFTAITATPSIAHGRYHDDDDRYEERGDDRYDNGGYDRRDNRSYNYDRGYNRYDNRGGYYQRGYRDRNQCDNGTGGTIVGAIAGGLAGHELAGRRGNRTAGVLIGGVIGAIAGGAIDRSNDPCRR